MLWRKGSFGTDSPDGSRFVERILTAVATLSAQNRDMFEYLVHAHVDHAAGHPVASLLPDQALTARTVISGQAIRC